MRHLKLACFGVNNSWWLLQRLKLALTLTQCRCSTKRATENDQLKRADCVFTYSPKETLSELAEERKYALRDYWTTFCQKIYPRHAS
ncbi:hypothetical protein BKG76_09655 [Mycobacteroides franklinii]|uniref:Uncharacterized protein n=1 Tax=Mycobacteroides franklinii TaxID=948102 RepID=A0A1S1L7Q3_9MYCO|nr:hypothetical protein BKG76_09655 [Mycobacteroides franklinii]